MEPISGGRDIGCEATFASEKSGFLWYFPLNDFLEKVRIPFFLD